jgi:hypothetical protein
MVLTIEIKWRNFFQHFFSFLTELDIKIASVFTNQGEISTKRQRELIQNLALCNETENILLRFKIAEKTEHDYALKIVQHLVYIFVEHVGFD